MYSDPTDDWYEWRVSHSTRDETSASLIMIATTVAVLLILPLMF